MKVPKRRERELACPHLRLTIFGTRTDGLTRYRCDDCAKQIAQKGQVPTWAYRRTAIAALRRARLE